MIWWTKLSYCLWIGCVILNFLIVCMRCEFPSALPSSTLDSEKACADVSIHAYTILSVWFFGYFDNVCTSWLALRKHNRCIYACFVALIFNDWLKRKTTHFLACFQFKWIIYITSRVYIVHTMTTMNIMRIF